MKVIEKRQSPLGQESTRVRRVGLAAAMAFVVHLGACAQKDNEPSVEITLEKTIRISDAGPGALAPAYVALAWSPVTSQIAISPFFAAGRQLVDPDTEKSIRFEPSLSLAAGVDLLSWSPKRAVLSISGGTRTVLFDTTKSPAEPPRVMRIIDNALPAPLVADGAGILNSTEGEVLLVAGKTNRKINPENAELLVNSLSSGERRLSWQFPSDDSRYYFHNPMPYASEGKISLVSWVRRSLPLPGGSNALMAPESWEIWIVDPNQSGPRCVAKPLSDLPPRRSVSRNGPVVSPNSRSVVVSSDWHQQPRLYNGADCSFEREIEIGDGPLPFYFAFSPDGRWLLGTSPMHQGTPQGRVYLWRTADWKLVLNEVRTFPYQGAFNRHSNRFAIGTVSGVYVYKINTP